MDTIMKPGEEVTGHIRWEQPVLTLYGYIAGETGLETFKIQCPQDGSDWTLTSSLPGQRDWRLSASEPDPLRKAAESWVAEFVSSLGAVFPDAAKEVPGHVAVMLLLDHDDGSLVDVVAYEDGLKAESEAQQTAEDTGYQVQVWTDRPLVPGTLDPASSPATPAPLAGEKESKP